jgi:hypothetical protein
MARALMICNCLVSGATPPPLRSCHDARFEPLTPFPCEAFVAAVRRLAAEGDGRTDLRAFPPIGLPRCTRAAQPPPLSLWTIAPARSTCCAPSGGGSRSGISTRCSSSRPMATPVSRRRSPRTLPQPRVRGVEYRACDGACAACDRRRSMGAPREKSVGHRRRVSRPYPGYRAGCVRRQETRADQHCRASGARGQQRRAGPRHAWHAERALRLLGCRSARRSRSVRPAITSATRLSVSAPGGSGYSWGRRVAGPAYARSSFFAGSRIDRITRALGLYLRQPVPDQARDRAAAAWLEADHWGEAAWW